MRERVKQRSVKTKNAAEPQACSHDPHMLHAAVGKKPLQVLLQNHQETGHNYGRCTEEDEKPMTEAGADGVRDDRVIANQSVDGTVQESSGEHGADWRGGLG